MLEAFVENDEMYRAYAFKLCKCHDLKNDLVNDMYINLHDILQKHPKKEIENSYIFLMIRSIFLNSIKKNKEYCLDKFPEICEPNNDNFERRAQMNQTLGRLSFFEREILLKTSETSLRKMALETNINYSSIHVLKQKALKKLKKIWAEEENLKD